MMAYNPLSNGLLGMGGFGSGGQDMPTNSLLGNFYDPAEMRKYQIKQMLIGMGAGLLAEKGMGKGLALGLAAGDRAGATYRDNAMAANGLDMRKKDQEWQNKAHSRQEQAWAAEDASSAQMSDLINSIQDPQERMYAQLNPEAYVKSKLTPPGGESGGYYGVPLPYQNADGSFGYGLPSKTGQFSPLQAPGNASFLSPFQTAQQKSAGTASGTQAGGAAAAIPGAQIDADAVVSQIDSILADPSLPNAIGYGNALGDYFVGNDVLNVRSQLSELEGKTFNSAYATLKGGGQITEVESAQAKQALADIKTARKMSDPKKFGEAMQRLKDAVNRGVQKLQAQAGQYAPQSGAAPASGGTQPRLKFNPQSGELE